MDVKKQMEIIIKKLIEINEFIEMRCYEQEKEGMSNVSFNMEEEEVLKNKVEDKSFTPSNNEDQTKKKTPPPSNIKKGLFGTKKEKLNKKENETKENNFHDLWSCFDCKTKIIMPVGEQPHKCPNCEVKGRCVLEQEKVRGG